MTTRAGTVGLLTGILAALIIDLLTFAFQRTGSNLLWIAIAGIIIVMILLGGFLTVRWSGSVRPWRNAVLGGLSGALAGMMLFCLWGAAAAGSIHWSSGEVSTLNLVIRQTMQMLLVLFLGGAALGFLGGCLGGVSRRVKIEVFDMQAPQMAMNASITAVPASILAAALAAVFTSNLMAQTEEAFFNQSTVELPLVIALLFVFLSQLALTLVIPHETRQSEHRSGMDEVKMAAYVDIATAPVLFLLLLLLGSELFTNPLVILVMVLSAGLSIAALILLIKNVLPRRAAFPIPQDDRQKAEARWFGSISKSRGSRLFMLCIGCGLVMVLPLYTTVLSVLININDQATAIGKSPWSLLLNHALASIGVMLVTVAALTLMYLFYLNLGRWFSRKKSENNKFLDLL